MEQSTSPNIRPERKKESNRLIYILIILFLLGMNGYLFYLYNKTGKELENEKSELLDTEKEKENFEKLLKEARIQIESFRGINDSLNDVIDEKNSELLAMANEIQGLLASKNLSKKEYDRAMEKYDKFKYYYEKTKKELEEKLIELNEVKKENTTLKETVKGLEVERDKSDDQKRKVEAQLENAKILEATNIEAKGVRIKSNGKEQETHKASSTEQLKMMFNIARNAVADKNRKDIFVKVIGPDGMVIQDEQAGSGKFKYAGQESIYTLKQSIDFTNNGEQITIYYKKAGDFKKGKYKFEMYCEGYILGSGMIELK